MAKCGRKAVPTKTKILRGNPGRRPISDREPEPPENVDECPDWLSEKAKAVWARVVPRLKAVGLFTDIDSDALVLYCGTWADYQMAQEHIALTRKIHQTTDWKMIRYAHTMLTHLNRLQREFGMTPSARVGLEVKEPVPESRNERGLKIAGGS